MSEQDKLNVGFTFILSLGFFLNFLGIFFGAIIGPLIVGTIMDLTGPASFFLQIAIFVILGLICMFFVKKGEAGDLIETTT